jgi:L-iditol 2-dehydrogenase
VAGILHPQLARLKGVKRIIVADLNPFRLRLAEAAGAYATMDAAESIQQRLRESNEGRLADQVMVCAGASQAAISALECVDKGGTITFFAVPDPTVRAPLPITQLWKDAITIKTSYGASPNDLEESLAILEGKSLDVKGMITHRLSIQQAAEGFRLAAKAGDSLKVIIEPNRT